MTQEIDVARDTRRLIDIIEEVDTRGKNKLFRERDVQIRELGEEFHVIFDKLPYDDQLAFISLAMTTDLLTADKCEVLFKRAEQTEQVRKIVEGFNNGYVGMTSPHTYTGAAVSDKIVWDSIP